MLACKISKTDFKDPRKWQQLGKDLELPAGQDYAIITRIPGLLPVKEGAAVLQNIPPASEWLWADDLDGKHSYIIHTRSPRFWAELADDDELRPPFEYQLKNGEWLCNFFWIDSPPEDLTLLLQDAEEFLTDYDQRMGLQDE
jgi:hypothetical protein